MREVLSEPARNLLPMLRDREGVLAERLAVHRPALGPRTAAVWRARRARTGDPGPALHRELRRGLALVTASTPVHELDATRYAQRAERHGALCARHDVPLAAVLTAYESCCGTVQELLWDGAPVGRNSGVHELTRHVARWFEQVCHAAADGYAAELERTSRRAGAVPAMAAALLLGHSPVGLARVAGVTPVRAYRVLLGSSPGSAPPWSTSVVDAAGALIGDLGTAPPVLHCVDGNDLVLLLPSGRADPRLGPLRNATRSAGVRWAVTPPTPVTGLTNAVRTARRTALLAYAAALPVDEVARPESVVVEELGLSDPVLRPWADLIGRSLAREPDLLSTVTTLYAADLDRSRTAQLLGIARRTLTSRLQRVQRSVGLSPTSATGIQVIGLALAAQRLAGVEGAAS